MRMENCNAFRNALGSRSQSVYFGIRYFLHFIRFYYLVLQLLSLPRLLSFLWLTYAVRQLYNEADFIFTKIEVLSMKQCMPSM